MSFFRRYLLQCHFFHRYLFQCHFAINIFFISKLLHLKRSLLVKLLHKLFFFCFYGCSGCWGQTFHCCCICIMSSHDVTHIMTWRDVTKVAYLSFSLYNVYYYIIVLLLSVIFLSCFYGYLSCLVLQCYHFSVFSRKNRLMLSLCLFVRPSVNFLVNPAM